MLNKKLSLVAVGIIFIVVFGIIAVSSQTASGTEEVSLETKQAVDQKLDEVVTDTNVKENAREYVEKFVEKKNIKADKIKNISQVNFEDLPKEVNIENVDNSNLAIYQVDYDEVDVFERPTGEEKQVFVITYSTNQLNEQGDLIIAHDKRQFLDFGFAGSVKSDSFLQTSAGVETSLEKGYVMVREGSITAVSTNLDITKTGVGDVEIIVYKNGNAINFGNTMDSGSIGVTKDHDIQSNGVVTFQPGDIISAKVVVNGATVEDVITMVEITTIN